MDDIIFISGDQESLEEVTNEFLEIFYLSWCLDVRIDIDKDSCKMSQMAKVSSVPKECWMENAKPFKTPTATYFYDLLEEDKNEPVVQGQKYRNISGSLFPLSNPAGLNIGTTVSVLGQYSCFPTEYIISAVKRCSATFIFVVQIKIYLLHQEKCWCTICQHDHGNYFHPDFIIIYYMIVQSLPRRGFSPVEWKELLLN